MSTYPHIRRADLRDLPQLAILFDLYRQFYQKDSDIPGAERFLTERMRNEESVLFVAETEQGTLCGFVHLYPTFTSLGMARCWILNDLYVMNSARRSGIARLLMNTAHELALATGARSINLETQIENSTAQSLYESLGYELETEFRFYTKVITSVPGPAR
jgi:ribosomal protein S18 acetylase RimI-like enzyme